MRTYSSSEARDNMRPILRDAEQGHCSVIFKYDTPTAVVVPWDWFHDTAAYVAAGMPNGREARMLAEAKEVLAAAQTGHSERESERSRRAVGWKHGVPQDDQDLAGAPEKRQREH